ncbi:tyrosine-protein phosphatase [Weissella sp. MSCH1]|uniref:tyrosine-protein phosphatase n=1 Tax=Weissella sp. MSCH1 TaxID=3383343 RepID=UPI003896EE03
MIDVHSHLLPNIDDGSNSLEASLQLARAAVMEGITHSLVTPHHMDEQYINHAVDVINLTAVFQAELERLAIPLTVFPAQEVRLTSELLTALDAGDILTTDTQGTFLLVELPANDVPLFTSEILFQLQQRGIMPVIVHPERNRRLMQEPHLLYDLVSQGAYAQVTASSYVGAFGKAVMAFSEDIIGHGLAQVVASDAHRLPGRQHNMAKAFEKLVAVHGSGLATEFNENAKALINGTSVSRRQIVPIKKNRLFSAY